MNTFFLDQFLKTSALLLVAAALVPIVARRSAARARLIWASAFAALLVLPLTAFVSPRWEYGNQAPPPIRVGPPPEIEIIRVAQPEAVAPVTPAVEAAPPLVVRTAKHWTWPSAGTCMFWGWVVGAGLLLVAVIIFASAKSALSQIGFVPTRAARNVQRDAAAIKEAYNDN